MLYLIRSFGPAGKSWLKVGFTDSIAQRISTYRVSNPGFQLLSIRPGDLTEETRTHLYLTACNLKADFLDEWFLDCPETLQRFHDSTERMDRWIWRKREGLFTAFDFSRRTPKVRIYEDLRFIHRNDSNNTIYNVDKEWKKWNLKRELEGRKKLLDSGYLLFSEI